MNTTSILILLGVLILFFIWKKAGQLSAKNADQLIKAGAIVIDCRSVPEFNAGHLPSAINIPVERIGEVQKKIQDRSTPLLLHCQSGMRSGMARKQLLGMGYTNVHNLGSYYRAASLLKK